jgi:hypothetical protein
MGQLISFGQKVQKDGIDRFDCAEGITVKGVLLNYAQPYARNIAYDETYRCYVECTPEMVVKYGLNPSPRYYFALATFATDANNNILGDKEQRVTYIQMSNNQYEHFLAASNNLASWHGYVTLAKKKQRGNNGKDYSFIEATPADDNAGGFAGVSQTLKDRINMLSTNEEFLKRTTVLIDNVTGLYEDKYLERKQNWQSDAPQAAAQPAPAPQAAPLPQPTAQATPAAQLPPQTVTVSPQTTVGTQSPDSFGAPTDEDLPF